nr:50S ribosomal protein L17 [Theileria orientalis]
MGFSSTCKFVNLGLKTRIFRKFRGQPTKSYDWIRNHIDKLLRNGRIEVTLPRAKELQQYIEELIYHAKRDTHESDLIVESVIRTPESRSLLYEKYIPLYKYRNFFFTRVINQFRLRQRDSSPMAFLELVDTENETFPAKPVGHDKLNHVLNLMKLNRRNYRKYFNYGRKNGLVDGEGNLIDEVKMDEKQWFNNDNNISTVDKSSLEDEDVRKRLDSIQKVDDKMINEMLDPLHKPNKKITKSLKFNP